MDAHRAALLADLLYLTHTFFLRKQIFQAVYYGNNVGQRRFSLLVIILQFPRAALGKHRVAPLQFHAQCTHGASLSLRGRNRRH